MPTFNGTIGKDRIVGSAGDDVISGADSGDVLIGGDGADIIYGFGANDTDPDSGSIGAQLLTSGLLRPVFGASPPGDPNRLFVLESHTGRVMIVDLATGAIDPTPFLDIPANELTIDDEQGLLGLAFHPDYATNGKLYINMTGASGDTEIWEYTRSLADPDQADVSSKRLILTIDQTRQNHQGGWMDFGTDGYLYIATGDGDVSANAQNINVLLGKILRLDVDGDDFPADPNRNYAIPPDNPFVGVAGADEIWAHGLRNPWRPSFDSATGDLYIADVGQNAWEELNFVAAGSPGGKNYGWSFWEGNHGGGGPNPATLTFPVLEYSHSGPALFRGTSITGGYVYHGPGGGDGLYFFADFVADNFWTVRVVGGVAQDWFSRRSDLRVDAGAVDQIASFAEDGIGRLYTIGLDGQIHRLTPSAAAGDAGDELHGGIGDDQLYGGYGADTLIGGPGADTLRGGLGVDRAIYGQAPSGVIVNLAAGTASGGDGADTLSAIENVVGSGFGDTLTGDGQANVLEGAGGDDNLSGGAGADDLIGGAGVDTLNGESGNDTLSGGANDDILNGGDNVDTLTGGLGNDTLNGGDGIDRAVYGAAPAGVIVDLVAGTTTGGDGSDSLSLIENLVGSPFDDVLTGDGGKNEFEGGGGADTLNGGGAADVLSGMAGADTLNGEGGDDKLIGDADNDILFGGIGTDRLLGGAGADSLNGGDGVDWADYSDISGAVTVSLGTGTASGAAGADTLAEIENLTGGAGGDVLTGNGGPNVIEGGEGGDTLNGGLGEDTLRGGLRNDILNGGDDNDTLVGGHGDDTFNGGAGSDRVLYTAAPSAVAVNLGAGTAAGGDGNDSFSLVEHVFGSNFDDSLTGDGGRNVMDGVGGNDTINGAGGDDELIGGVGADTLNGDANNDTLIGGAGADILDGGDGIDRAAYHRATGAVTVNLGTGIGAGADGADTLQRVENLVGSAFGDSLTGSSGVNLIEAGGGGDIITGGLQADVLYGNAGADRFVFTALADSLPSARDLIGDFEAGDLIDLSAIDADATTPANDAFHLSNAPAKGGVLVVYDTTTNLTWTSLFVNDDGIADAQIWLTGNKTALLDTGAFLL